MVANAFKWDSDWARDVAGDYVPTRYGGSGKQVYHDAARKVLRQLAADLGLGKADFEYRRCMGGPAVRGDSILHTDRLYVAIGYSGWLGVMARQCRGREDYSGGTNNWLPYADLNDPAKLLAFARRVQGPDPVPYGSPRPRTRKCNFV